MQKMSKSEFQDWKEVAQFFWDHLAEVQADIKEAQFDIANQLGYSNPERTVELVALAKETAIKYDTLQEVLDLDYEDIFEQEEEENHD